MLRSGSSGVVALQGAVGCLGCLVGGAVLDACVSLGTSLLLRFGGVWVDVKICSCFVWDVVASKVWGCVGGC